MVPVLVLYPALRDAGQWGYEGHSAGRSGWPHLAWAMWLPCVFAVVVAGLFVVVDLAGMVIGSWDTPVAGLGWLKAGAIGQFGLVIVAAAVLIAGTAHPGWRRGAAITAYAIIALEIGWFLLTRMLVQDHPRVRAWTAVRCLVGREVLAAVREEFAGSGIWPGGGPMNAAACSPNAGPGTPATATPATAGWPDRTCSISRGSWSRRGRSCP